MSSLAKNQQWRNDLLMKPAEPTPKPLNEIFREVPQQKYPGHTVQPGHPVNPVHPVRPSHPVCPGHPVHPGQPGHPGTPLQPGQLGQPGRPTAGGPPSHAYNPDHASNAGQAGQRGRQVLTNASVCCEQPNCKRAKIEHMPPHYFQEQATPFKLVNPADGCGPQSAKKEPAAPPSDPEHLYCGCGKRGQLVTICCTGRNCDNSTKIDEGIHMGLPDVHMCHPDVKMCPPDVKMSSPVPPKNTGSSGEKRVKSSYNQYKY